MKKILVIIIFTFITLFGNAQESVIESIKKNLELSGSLDVYFRQNFDALNEEGIAPNTAFANLNGFALGFVNLALNYQTSKVGGVVDLVFGPRGEDAVFLSRELRPEGSSNIINQLFIYWNINKKAKITFGNFNTYLGYELISPVTNFNYSTSYMFSGGPFSHTGIKLDYQYNKDWSFMLGVFNSTDETEFNVSNNYTTGLQAGYKNVFLNILYGRQRNNSNRTFQIDLTTGHQFSENFFIGLNSTYKTTEESNFYGVALYPKYTFSKEIQLGLRAEYFVEQEEGAGLIGVYDQNGNANVFDITLTGNYNIGDLSLKPEIRLDRTSEDSFFDDDGQPRNFLVSIVIAAIYKL
ncbi:outer membrane beta-barrel protein [Aquimarina sp. 2201CG5-10]|uniref:outer membrane beta-barrel protein n=1 Tax=Aquimarina callyspongiae TaxID=3098150 RepID=UPI002AB3EA5B|nr:outer membrane beta-barrel protein [Aquimarina sp. 2201CG5-10]MDY8138417.1 outer membrane beta-barrel protein [Aquimarina sp. 2201CG5-10]